VSSLLDGYDMAQYQAVLLRAVHVTAHVVCHSPAQYRALFRALKFRRLLHVIHPEPGGYRIEIDGPFSLFESVTKYGLQLALIFPVLRMCDSLRLVADIRWGKTRQALRFEYEQDTSAVSEQSESVSEEVAQLIAGLKRLEGSFQVSVNEELLELPGVGLCVPDLVFHKGTEKVYLEVMGYWSRDALWKRIELAQAGLPHCILFAASSRLRVSEEVLEPTERAALYVYKGTMNAKAVAEQVARLWRRG
jgi:predicted nuclease of restriction endonuclease-like RecB superfamily